MEKKKILPLLPPPLSPSVCLLSCLILPEVRFFAALTNDWQWIFWCLEQRKGTGKAKSLRGRPQEIAKLLRKQRPLTGSLHSVSLSNMMKILSALLITSSLNRAELFITNSTSDCERVKQQRDSLAAQLSTVKHHAGHGKCRALITRCLGTNSHLKHYQILTAKSSLL